MTDEERFKAFHAEHPEVYDHLIATARDWKSKGYPYCSMSDSVGRARWDLRISVSGTFNTFYSDLIMAQEPDLAGFFRRHYRRSGKLSG